ncbi:MAG TPA: alpha/beta fold hydrolase [Candidatus Limnocylindrales bacterium]|nr:alpha/beta fold hydrolase [Candidatus Limnocylindrales bacterium]
MLRKILKYLAIATFCLFVVALSSALLYRKHLQNKVAAKRAIHSPRGINSLEAVRIGGIDQWIQVRGQDVDNPILLFIHGGPGVAFIPLAGSFQGPWEKYFTVVQWDQRGAGKTYASNNRDLQRRTMNVPQMEQDTLDVVNYLRNRFHRKKIFVLGHSWGSVLGLWLAHEHPDLIYAYVGVGQAVNLEQNDSVAYQDALQEALKRHNEQAIKELKSIVPYPSADTDFNKQVIARSWEEQLLGPPPSAGDFTDTRRILTDLVSAPEYSLADDVGFIRGQSLSLDTFFAQVEKVDLTQMGLDFRTPIFFFEGRHDPYCRPQLIWQYGQAIRAPQKEFVWFDNAGHFPFYEDAERFTDALVQRVLPLAKDKS